MNEHTDVSAMELKIIGTMIQQPDKAGEAFSVLSASDFGIDAYGRIFAAIERLRLAGAPVDPLTLEHELGSEFRIILRQAQIVEPVDLTYYAEMLKEHGKMQLIQNAALNVAYAPSYSAAASEMDGLNTLFVAKKNARVVSAMDAASDFCDRASAARPEYLSFGMTRLDSLLYMELGDMMIIGGYPSSGKTLLSLQMAAHLSEKYRVGFFSLETNPAKLTDRLLSHLSHVPLKKIKDRDLSEADRLALTRSAEKLSGMKLDFIDAGGMTVRDIQALGLSRKYQVIFIDYLQLIVGIGRQSRYDQVTQVSQELHTLGRAHGIAVIALAQLKRPEKEKGKFVPPSMADFRESGQIEQDADSALLVYPVDQSNYRSNRWLHVAKNKEGLRDRYELEFDGATQTMRERPKSYGETQAEIRRACKTVQADRRAQERSQVTFDDITDSSKEPLPF